MEMWGGVLTQPLLRSSPLSSPAALTVSLLCILMAAQRAVKEEVIDCAAWPLFVLTLTCLGVWMPCVRVSHERAGTIDELYDRQSSIVIPTPQLPSGLSVPPAAFWNKGRHVCTDELFRPCFSDLSVAPGLTYSSGCTLCMSDTRLR